MKNLSAIPSGSKVIVDNEMGGLEILDVDEYRAHREEYIEQYVYCAIQGAAQFGMDDLRIMIESTGWRYDMNKEWNEKMEKKLETTPLTAEFLNFLNDAAEKMPNGWFCGELIDPNY